MGSSSKPALQKEAERISQVYARRSKSVSMARYSLLELPNLLLIQELERRVLRLVRQHIEGDLGGKKLLEVGCGAGHWLRQFVQWGAKPNNLAGVDLLPDR